MNVETRKSIERSIVKLTIQTLLDAGCRLTINLHNDTENNKRDEIKDFTEHTLDDVMASDSEYLFVNDDNWVYFIFGNDGWDVIADYSLGIEKIMDPLIDEICKKETEYDAEQVFS